jgi:ubiquinone/menaquinone biosynthesis C-methylase UbiE
MMDRRKLFTMTGAAAMATALRPLAAEAKEALDLDLRGMNGQLKRLPSLDVVSNQEFLTEVRTWVQRAPDGLFRTARARAREILRENGLSPRAELTPEQAMELLDSDVTLKASARAWLGTQQLTWDGLKQHFHANFDVYMDTLRAAEKKGPGTLELRPNMHIPDYTKHEIHIQPGGYVGDPLGGYIYHYGTNNFFMGHNDQDEVNAAVVKAAPRPEKGKVRRILEIGCSAGQTAVALKRRYPDAEVWGIDIGGPMVHYAHMRASQMGVDVNFMQALAEDTGFPDGHFDMVVSYIILHEVPNVKNTEIMKEVSRVLRPGGTYYPVDFYTSMKPPKDAYGLFHRWWDHRWNGEVWAWEHMQYDLEGDLERFGMAVTPDGPGAVLMLGGRARPRPNLFATKRA